MQEIFQGIPASNGMAIGKCCVLQETKHLIPRSNLKANQIDAELKRFKAAIEQSRAQIRQSMDASVFDDQLKEIFEMQLLLLEDPMLIDESIEKIKHQKINAEQALIDEISNLKSFLLKSKNRVFEDRVADLEDMGDRIISNLMGIPEGDIKIPILSQIKKDSILVAKDISPSLMLHIRNIAGIVVEQGGITGHMAILAKSRGIPCIVNVKGILDAVKNGDQLMLDAISGICVIEPDAKYLDTYTKFTQRKESEKLENIQSPVLTSDKHNIELWTNLDDPQTTQDVRIQGSSGVGLFRTEFLYLKETDLINNPLKQKNLYEKILNNLNHNIVTFRLLDTSNEKPLPGQAIIKDRHLAGVQFLLANIKITRMQIRSIFEAAINSPKPDILVRIMIPMVANVDEVEAIQNLCGDIKAELASDLNIGFKELPSLQLGVMLETSSSIMMIPELNQICDFFSIGSNDLAHLTLGLPRQNPHLTKEDLFFQPALYRMMKMITTQAQKPVTICGEIAARIDIIPLLIGIGLDKLSVTPASLKQCARIIEKISYADCQQLSVEALKCDRAEKLHSLLTRFISRY